MRNQLAKIALREAMREPDIALPNEVKMEEEDACQCPKCGFNGPKEDFVLEAELDEPEPEAPESDEDY